MNSTIHTISVPRTLAADIRGKPCFIEATLTEHIDVRNGDVIDQVRVERITSVIDGQSIIPSILSFAELRELTTKIKRTNVI